MIEEHMENWRTVATDCGLTDEKQIKLFCLSAHNFSNYMIEQSNFVNHEYSYLPVILRILMLSNIHEYNYNFARLNEINNCIPRIIKTININDFLGNNEKRTEIVDEISNIINNYVAENVTEGKTITLVNSFLDFMSINETEINVVFYCNID